MTKDATLTSFHDHGEPTEFIDELLHSDATAEIMRDNLVAYIDTADDSTSFNMYDFMTEYADAVEYIASQLAHNNQSISVEVKTFNGQLVATVDGEEYELFNFVNSKNGECLQESGELYHEVKVNEQQFIVERVTAQIGYLSKKLNN